VKESLLSLAWEKQYFDVQNTFTLDGKKVNILQTGLRNRHQGPDFLNAEIVIDGLRWWGTVEIHVNGEDWYRHGHHQDENYNSVILHVVHFPSSPPPVRADGFFVPEILFRPHVPSFVIASYESIIKNTHAIPCSKHPNFSSLPPNVIDRWLKRMFEERLEEKICRAEEILAHAEGDWEQAAWVALAGAFAGPINKDAFHGLAHAVHRKTIIRSSEQPEAIIALFLGATKLLDGKASHPYPLRLYELWKHLKTKYDIQQIGISLSYLRMRPAAFPVVRLVQLAGLWEQIVKNGRSILDYCLKPKSLLEDAASAEYHEYWKKRVKIGEEGKNGVTRPGKDFLVTVLANAIYPMSALYARRQGRPEIIAEWMRLLDSLSPEDNRVVRDYRNAGFPNDHVPHSQALVHLRRNYCLHKRCLDCDIGKFILTHST
jgi:hypothetical protein